MATKASKPPFAPPHVCPPGDCAIHGPFSTLSSRVKALEVMEARLRGVVAWVQQYSPENVAAAPGRLNDLIVELSHILKALER